MQKARFGKTLVAGTLAVALVAMGIPLAAVGLGGDVDILNGSLQAAIAYPPPGMEFSRVEDVPFRDGTVASQCPVASWTWDFGDQTALSFEADPVHGYDSLGNKEATLVVFGECGRVDTASVILRIVNLKPVARLAVNPASASPGQSLTLDGAASSDADGSVATYQFVIDGANQALQGAPTLQHTFTTAGQHTVGLRVVDNEGRVSDLVEVLVQVAPGPLATLSLAPVLDSLPAGGSQAFAASGRDAWGNAVAVTPAWNSTCGSVDQAGFFAAPTSVGPCAVQAAQDGISASDSFDIVAGPLASIHIAGPDRLVAGASAVYDLSGADAFGNPVALAAASIAYQAPTAAGSEQLCHAEQGISACKVIEILPDALAAIVVSGPSEVVAGASAAYAVEGFDQFGNAVALAAAGFDWTAPTVAGPAQACFAEQGIEGCAGVEVVPDALASITLHGPAVAEVAQHRVFALSGADQYGNPVALAQAFLEWTAPTLAGWAQACYAEQGLQGCKDIEVLAGPVSAIAVSGPSEVVAGQPASFALSGADAHGNPVPLAQSSLDWTAPTLAQATQVCYSEGDATGCADVAVIPDALDSIVVTGPAELVAGASAAYAVEGLDQYGNPVALAQASFDYTAPHLAGAAQACYAEQGIAGCAGVQVVPDALASIVLTGPATVPAGSSADFDLGGFDQHGNPVALALESLHWTAPSSPGPLQVCYGEQGVQGCASVEVTPAGLDRIEVSGPAEVLAGSTHHFSFAGYDPFGNPVALAVAGVDWDAPTAAGPAQVCHQEQGVLGCAEVLVVAGPLASIAILGPAEVVAGHHAAFDLSGRDAFGNPVALAQSSLDYAAPTAAGPAQVCHQEQGVSACHALSVLPDALASIVVSGPSEMVVGSSADFAAAGFDQYGNPVALAQASLAHVAPTEAGPGQVCHGEQGIIGCSSVQYLPDALASIAVSGPESVVAARAAQFTLAGSDQHGNPVALAQGVLDWVAPEQAGPAQVCHAEQGIEGCKAVEVLADALFAISVHGPDQVVAGSAAEYLLSGADQYGNPVALEQASLPFEAPRRIGSGSASVCHTEDGVSGCKTVSLVPDALASIAVSGPDSLVAGQAGSFGLEGFDQYGNPVALGAAGFDWTAPTAAGAAQACWAEQGIEGCKSLEVLPDALASIAVSGPASAPAGSMAWFTVDGADQYGNPVALAADGFDWAAPTLAGPAQACYAEQGLEGCAAVDVVPGPLADIAVTGPASLAAGESGDFAVAGSDAFGNPVALAVAGFTWPAPTLAGPAQACYAEQGVEGCADVLVVAGPLDRIVVSPGDARTNVNQGKDIQFSAAGRDAHGNPVALDGLAWAADKGTISPSGLYKAITAGSATVTATSGGVSGSAPVEVLNTLGMSIVTNFDRYAMGSPVRGHALVRFADGDAVQSAKVTLKFSGLSPTGMMCGGTFEGLTNGGGLLAFQAPPDCARFVGDYRIDGSAIWKANRGAASKVYHVTL